MRKTKIKRTNSTNVPVCKRNSIFFYCRRPQPKDNLCHRAESQEPQVLALVPQALSNLSQILSAEQGTDVFSVS